MAIDSRGKKVPKTLCNGHPIADFFPNAAIVGARLSFSTSRRHASHKQIPKAELWFLSLFFFICSVSKIRLEVLLSEVAAKLGEQRPGVQSPRMSFFQSQ